MKCRGLLVSAKGLVPIDCPNPAQPPVEEVRAALSFLGSLPFEGIPPQIGAHSEDLRAAGRGLGFRFSEGALILAALVSKIEVWPLKGSASALVGIAVPRRLLLAFAAGSKASY